MNWMHFIMAQKSLFNKFYLSLFVMTYARCFMKMDWVAVLGLLILIKY
jgi:hypothetical protein